MASLVGIQDLSHSAPANFLADSDVTALISGIQSVPLPTPPLSPQHMEAQATSRPESYSIDHTIDVALDDQEASALLDQMLKSEGFTDAESYLSTDGTAFVTTPESDSLLLSAAHGMELLIQDCMWNSHEYEPRSIIGNVNGGVYTPAPSPPPSEQPQDGEEQQQQEIKENPESENSKETNEEPEEVQAECISPCDIFPTYTLVTDKEGSRVEPKPGSVTTTCVQNEGSRHHQAMSSESDEEIDVVTVTTERPPTATRMATRKRQLSISAPCSRQTSPSPPSPKKRKYAVKRLQRINSSTSSVGDGTESDDEHRRASHNILERKRRNDLKFSFQILREQVPDLEENQRAPKVTILRKAAEYIRRIQLESNASEQELERERKREARLRQRLAFLKAMPVLA